MSAGAAFLIIAAVWIADTVITSRHTSRLRTQLRVALRQLANATTIPAAANAPLDVAILIERVHAGEATALRDLWQRLYGRTVDPARPIGELGDECNLAIAAEYGQVSS